MRELSVFVDESGDFGPYAEHSPYYIIALVFHNQDDDLSKDILALNERLDFIANRKLCIHAGPVIRSEGEYRGMRIKERRRVLSSMMSFVKNAKFHYATFLLEKKFFDNREKLSAKLTSLLNEYLISRRADFERYDAIKIYYDNGQIEISRILASIWNAFCGEKLTIKKALPVNYRLFQVADLVCTATLLNKKLEASTFSKTELDFFVNTRNFKKNLLKPLRQHRIN